MSSRSKTNELQATCKDMCPSEEVNFRVKNNMVHALEKKIINSKTQYMLVKEYSRPAAGKTIKSSELRTLDTLVTSTDYLIKNIYSMKGVEFIVIYEFLFDRFRAIRQDLIIQRWCNNDERCARILQTILRFYLVSDYKLCGNKNYDEFINNQHVTEVLQQIIGLSDITQPTNAVYHGVYLLYNLNNWRAIMNVLKLPKEIRKTEPLKSCISLCFEYINRNFVRMFRVFQQLPLLCQLVFHQKIPLLERELINVYNTSYSWKNTKYPIEDFLKVSFIDSEARLRKYERELKVIQVDAENNIIFAKSNSSLNEKKTLPREPLTKINENLKKTNEIDFLLLKS